MHSRNVSWQGKNLFDYLNERIYYMNNKIVFLLIVFSFLVFSAGCGNSGGKYKVVPLSGTLTYQGQPFGEGVLITFTPEEGRLSTAVANKEGKFKAEYTDSLSGVQAGKLKVTIAPYGTSSGFLSPQTLANSSKSSNFKEAFDKYAFGGEGFDIEVDKKSNDFKLDLP